MRWIGRTSRGPIGIDLGSRWIKAVQVSSPGWQPTLEAAVALPRLSPGGPLNDAEVQRLFEVLERQGFTGRQIVLAAPNESLITGMLSLPPRGSGAPVEQIARMELSRMHKCDPQAIELSYWDLPLSTTGGAGKPGGTAVMAVACPHADASALLDRFESVGLEVVGMDVHWLALARACQSMWDSAEPGDENKGDLNAVLDLGWCTARLIVLHDGVVTFERVLTEGGLEPLASELKSKFNLDDLALDCVLRETELMVAPQEASPEDEAADDGNRPPRRRQERSFDDVRRMMMTHAESLVSELQVSLDYAMQTTRGSGVNRLLLTGGGSLRRLDEMIAQRLTLKVRTITPADLLRVPPALTSLAANPTLIAAQGLATYAC